MAKTGIKIKCCNVGSVEAHNERTKEYLEGLEKAGREIYFFPDLTPSNVGWVNPRYDGKSCQTLFEEAKQLYKDKTDQEPQLKDRERINKKTGKKTIISGWSPIREGVVPIKEDTTIEDFKPVIDWAHTNGLDVIRIDLHFDEGHIDAETNEKKLNRHAHIVFDWLDHETGRTIKLDKSKMSELQDVIASALGMERGTPKAETGIEHLSAAEYRERKAMENARQMENRVKELDQDISAKNHEYDEIAENARQMENHIKELDQDITAKNHEYDEIAEFIKSERERKAQITMANNDLETIQNSFKQNIGDILMQKTKDMKEQIENTSVKISLFGSKKDRNERAALRSSLLDSLNEVIQNPTAHLKELEYLPDQIREEYRRMDAQAERHRVRNAISDTESPARLQTNNDLRKLHPRETELLDEMNLQQLSWEIKNKLLGGEPVTLRQKWYDPLKSKHTDEEEATLSVSDWKLKFNGKALREFLEQVWVKMAQKAQELKESVQRRFSQEQTQMPGKGLKR